MEKFSPKKLKLFRKSKGLSVLKLAEITGLTPVTLYLLEKGQNNPRVDTLSALAHALHCKIGDFFITEPVQR